MSMFCCHSLWLRPEPGFRKPLRISKFHQSRTTSRICDWILTRCALRSPSLSSWTTVVRERARRSWPAKGIVGGRSKTHIVRNNLTMMQRHGATSSLGLRFDV
jgi:hypothetical protein